MASNVDGLVRQYAELITQDATGVIAERDRRSLHAFTRRMVDKYIVADHLNRMMDALTWAATTPNARLIITMPPRFGKSLTMSENFPAWYLGQFPDNRIIAASHTAALAYTFSRRVRNKIADPRYPFPDVRIAEDKGAVQAWDIAGRHGGYYSVGVGGSPTGIGANLILVDDALRSASDAASPIVRESIKEWYRETLRTRLEPGGSIVITATRWHTDDLTGYLLSEMEKGGEAWRHLHLPAIDDHGHSLWPERWSVDELLRIKASVGSHGWNAQYQGRPVPQEGGTLKEHWFGTYLTYEFYPEIITAWDTAFKTGSANDMSAAVSIGIGSGGLDVLDVFASRLEFPDLERAVQDVHLALSSRFPRSVITTLIEDKGSGQSLIQTIRRKPYNTMNIIDVPAARTDEKLRRVNEISPIVESGRVRLPDTASWKQDALTEWTTFPFARHDDRTDAFAMAVARAAGLTGVHDEVQDVSAFAPVTTIRRRRK